MVLLTEEKSQIKIQNGKLPKKLKMEDDQKIQNGRQPKIFKMEVDQKNQNGKIKQINIIIN